MPSPFFIPLPNETEKVHWFVRIIRWTCTSTNQNCLFDRCIFQNNC